MASAELSRRIEKVVAYPPLSELESALRREFHEALLEAHRFEDLPGKWQAVIWRRRIHAKATPGPDALARTHRSNAPCRSTAFRSRKLSLMSEPRRES